MEVLIVDIQHWRVALRMSSNRTVGVKVFIEQEVLALTRDVNGQTEHARMDLVFYLDGSVTYLDVSIVAPFSCNPVPGVCCQHKTRPYGQESGEDQVRQVPHTSILSRSFLRQLADLAHMPGTSFTTYCEMPITRH